MLIELLEALSKVRKKRKPVTGYQARVMITGTIFDNPLFPELFEAQGAQVVTDRYCFGSMSGMEPITEDGNPWEKFTKYSAVTCECARMIEKFEKRYQHRLNYMNEFDVDGIIIQTLKFSYTWRSKRQGISTDSMRHGTAQDLHAGFRGKHREQSPGGEIGILTYNIY